MGKVKNTSQKSKVRMAAKLLCFAGIIALTCASSSASDFKFPKPVGYVNDYADVIDASSEAMMRQVLIRLEKKTSAEVVVVTVKSTQPMDIDTYAVELFNKWGIGKKALDNGVLILMSKDDRRIKIETGKGIEDVLPDGYCGRLIDEEIIPSFKQEHYGEGLYKCTIAVARKIYKDYKPLPLKEKKKKSMMIFLGILVVLLVVSVIVASTKKMGDNTRNAVIGALIGGVIGLVIAGVGGFIFGVIMGLASGAGGFRGGYFGSGGFGTWGGGFGGGSFGGGGGSFGGFGGGGSGGGGAGRSW
ncbi:MAG: TPM domain-containing protein [Candidatus Saganbacteria bacterium]|nr:TPM domain-containing protein [Candidatus Saganbacteria bacterium]